MTQWLAGILIVWIVMLTCSGDPLYRSPTWECFLVKDGVLVVCEDRVLQEAE